MATESWLTIPRWDDFQHYSKRDPIWVKVYTRLLSDDRYVGLSFHQRGILQGIWLEYARANRQLPGSTLALSRRLGGRVTTRDLNALSDAGFIEIIASSPLASRYHDASPETEREAEEEKEKNNPVTEPVLQHPARAQDDGSGSGGEMTDEELDQLAAIAALTQAAAPGDIPW